MGGGAFARLHVAVDGDVDHIAPMHQADAAAMDEPLRRALDGDPPRLDRGGGGGSDQRAHRPRGRIEQPIAAANVRLSPVLVLHLQLPHRPSQHGFGKPLRGPVG
jgi:hypothetical protein